MEKIKKYHCLTCDGTGQADISTSRYSDGSPIYRPSICPSCCGRGWVSRIWFGIQATAGVGNKNNLEIIELYEKAEEN